MKLSLSSTTSYSEKNTLGLAQSVAVSAGFWARIIGQGSGGSSSSPKHHYKWMLVERNDEGEWENQPDAQEPQISSGIKDDGVITSPAVEYTENQWVPIDGHTVVWLTPGYVDTETGEVEFVFDWQEPVLCPCIVEMETGDAGDENTQCTFSYSAKTMDNRTLIATADAQQPACQRPEFGMMLEAKRGSYYRDAAGDVKLFWVDEVPEVDEC